MTVLFETAFTRMLIQQTAWEERENVSLQSRGHAGLQSEKVKIVSPSGAKFRHT